MGIWATCARRMEGRATEELKGMFEEVGRILLFLEHCTDTEQCAERFYGLVPGAGDAKEGDESGDDIEASIKREVASLDDKRTSTKLFSPVHLDLECVLFFKTRIPIDPVDFVHRICEEIVSNPDVRKMRYANRLTPVTTVGKATEKGLEEVGRTVLGAHFQLSDKEEKGKEAEEPQQHSPYSVNRILISSTLRLVCGHAARRHGATASISFLGVGGEHSPLISLTVCHSSHDSQSHNPQTRYGHQKGGIDGG